VAPGYNGHCRDLTDDQIAAYKGQGRGAVIRMRMPDGSTTFTDEIRGDVTFDHKFVPDIIYVPVDKVVKIRVSNLDSTIEEFESFDLKREKTVPANGKITVTVGPLSHGEYSFFGEFHQETAQGKLIVK
jgi:hypothetical protein